MCARLVGLMMGKVGSDATVFAGSPALPLYTAAFSKGYKIDFFSPLTPALNLFQRTLFYTPPPKSRVGLLLASQGHERICRGVVLLTGHHKKNFCCFSDY